MAFGFFFFGGGGSITAFFKDTCMAYINSPECHYLKILFGEESQECPETLTIKSVSDN